jgi:iron-sulfur cluster repair protein YtfE (RIC family)
MLRRLQEAKVAAEKQKTAKQIEQLKVKSSNLNSLVEHVSSTWRDKIRLKVDELNRLKEQAAQF